MGTDAAEAHALATAWMELGLEWLPLHIAEPEGDEVLAATVRRVVEEELRGRATVTVLVPEMDLGRWWQPLLHRGTGRAIAWHLSGLRDVTTAVLPVPVRVGAYRGGGWVPT